MDSRASGCRRRTCGPSFVSICRSCSIRQRIKRCISAGEPLPKATSDAWFAATGLRLIDGIGATELIHIFISAKGEQIRPGVTGKPLPGYQACILDADGRPLPPGKIG